MGIFSRFKDIVSSNISAMLDKAEDPEKLVRLMIREMEETLVELKAGCAASMAEARRVRRELDGVLDQVDRWDRRAELAVTSGREDLAREALLERRRENERADALRRELDEIDALVGRTQGDMDVLDEKLATAREKQRMLVQRHVHARVRRQAREDVRRAASLDVMHRFEELERRVEHMEAEADAVRIPSGRGGNGLDAAFADLETREELDRELAALRARVDERKSGGKPDTAPRRGEVSGAAE